MVSLAGTKRRARSEALAQVSDADIREAALAAKVSWDLGPLPP